MRCRFGYDDALDVVGVHLVSGLVGGAVLVHAFVASGMIGRVVDELVGFRIEEEHEVDGIDLEVHAESAFDLHAAPGARSAGHSVLRGES